ncbi:hypothetical protein SCFA_190005 [anaerobic digester metagenome]|uniref:Uncharacterized protein n=1 Tax=anaerobic digester metagenome TaxID=1263854 RepID=A0A485M009_9ZZZZ
MEIAVVLGYVVIVYCKDTPMSAYAANLDLNVC